jgi:hypothetical protein
MTYFMSNQYLEEEIVRKLSESKETRMSLDKQERRCFHQSTYPDNAVFLEDPYIQMYVRLYVRTSVLLFKSKGKGIRYESERSSIDC